MLSDTVDSEKEEPKKQRGRPRKYDVGTPKRQKTTSHKK